MVLTIIALILALAAIALFVFNAVRIYDLTKEAERVSWQLKGLEASLAALKAEPKETIVEGLEGVTYDPESGSVSIAGNLTVEGWVSAGEMKSK